MARIRTIKPQFFDDEKLSTITLHARYMYIGLWGQSDDYGVVKGNTRWLKTKIFPYDPFSEDEVAEWLGQLQALDLIRPFERNHEKFYYMKNLLKHQVINRISEARNPEPPPEIIEDSLSAHRVLTDDSVREKEKEKKKEEEEYKEKEGDCKGKHKTTSSKPFNKGKSQKNHSITIPLSDGTFFHVPKDFITKLQQKYPNRDIESELNQLSQMYSLHPPFRPSEDQVLPMIENRFKG